MSKPLAGDGKSTDQLFVEAFESLRNLKKEMTRRRSRDRASTLLTDAYVTIEQIGRRLAAVGKDFDSRPVRRAAEDDEEDYEPQAEQRAMVELFSVEIREDEMELDEELTRKVLDYRASYESIRQVRLRHYREFLDYILEGCSQLSDVTAKVLAIGRRVRPSAMEQFGISQVDVSRKLAKKRATVSAREKRLVEKPLKRNGTKGFHLLGGTRSDSQREACARAQMGNTNRRDGEERKRAS